MPLYNSTTPYWSNPVEEGSHVHSFFSFFLFFHCILALKNALFLSVNVFSTKVLIKDSILTSPTGDGATILCGHPSHAKVWLFARKAKVVLSFLSYFSQSISPASGIEDPTSCSAIKDSTE